MAIKVYAKHLSGQCRSGADGSGTLVHAVPEHSPKALCGRTYGRHSAGWSDYLDREVTCPRCLRKMAKAGDIQVIQPEG